MLFAVRLVTFNTVADAVFAVIQVPLFRLSEMTAILRHIGLFGFLKGRFAFFQMSRLFGIQSSVFDSVGDALLLTRFAAVHLIDTWMSGIDCSRSGLRAGCGLSKGGTGHHQTAHCQDDKRTLEIAD